MAMGRRSTHQNRSEPARKQRCSTSCQASCSQGEVVGGGDVPQQEGDVHGQPGGDRRDNGMGESAQAARAQDGVQQATECSGNAAQQRDGGPPGEEERRNGHHEQQVLDHVRGEDGVGELLQWGGEGKPEDGDAGDERGGAPGGERRPRAVEEDEAAQIEGDGEDAGEREGDRGRPVGEEVGHALVGDGVESA